MCEVQTYFVGIHSHLFIVGCGGFLCSFLLPLRSSAEEDVVDQCVLQQSQEDEDETAHQVHVNGFDIRDLWKSLPQMCVDGGHGQHSGDTCGQEGLIVKGANHKKWIRLSNRNSWKQGFINTDCSIPFCKPLYLDIQLTISNFVVIGVLVDCLFSICSQFIWCPTTHFLLTYK